MKTYGFSLKRLFGITKLKQAIARKAVPITKTGRQRKLGSWWKW